MIPSVPNIEALGTFIYCWCDSKNSRVTELPWKKHLAVSYMVGYKLDIPGAYPRETRADVFTKTYVRTFVASLFIITNTGYNQDANPRESG